MTDSRSLARDLLNRAGAGAVAPVPRTPPPPRAGRGVRRVEDLPQVRASLARDAQMCEAETALGARTPFYRSHQGFNGATISLDGQQLINFSSYNYLGLAGHPKMIEASKAAIDEYGTTSGASADRLGQHPAPRGAGSRDHGGLRHRGRHHRRLGFSHQRLGDLLRARRERPRRCATSWCTTASWPGTLWSHARRMQFRHNDPESLDADAAQQPGATSRTSW